MLELAVRLAGAAIKLVSETEEQKKARLEEEQKKKEEQQKEADAARRIRTAAGQTKGDYRTELKLYELESQIQSANYKLEDIETVVQRIREILERPENAAVRAEFLKRLYKGVGRDDIAAPGETDQPKDPGKAAVTERDIRRLVSTNADQLRGVADRVTEIQGRSFFARNFVQNALEFIQDQEAKQSDLLRDNRISFLTTEDKRKLQLAIAALDEIDEGMAEFQAAFKRVTRTQRTAAGEKTQAA